MNLVTCPKESLKTSQNPSNTEDKVVQNIVKDIYNAAKATARYTDDTLFRYTLSSPNNRFYSNTYYTQERLHIILEELKKLFPGCLVIKEEMVKGGNGKFQYSPTNDSSYSFIRIDWT